MAPSVSRSEDCDIFDRFMQGDDAAAVKLFRKYNHQLFLYCSKILGNGGQAEDITQEIWERVIKLRANPQEVHNPAGLLFRIARNLCINQVKARRHSLPLNEIDESHHPHCTIPGTSDLEELVLASLDGLGFEDREVLILNIYCGYRLDEIAAMMEKSSSAIWSRASRARAQLRTIVTTMMRRTEETRPARQAGDPTEDEG